MEDLVSIVIPTYNRADLVEEAILSSVKQTYPNKEILVVDDGSTDNTKEVCKKYVSSGQIRYIYKPNGGTASALNRGIAEMKGSWFKWLSSDDVLLPSAVEELLRFATVNNAKFVYSDFVIIDLEGNKIGEFIESTYATYLDFAASLWQYHIGHGSSSLIHKSVFEQTGIFDTKLRSREDYDFWLRACIVHGIMFYRCPQILLRYRVHPTQITSQISTEALRNDMKTRNRIKRQYIEMHGKENWNQLMIEFRKRGHVRPLWRRMARRLLALMPKGASDSIANRYKKIDKKKAR
ncbi:MAG: glycosyltransferase [Nitrososphaerales archaeon]